MGRFHRKSNSSGDRRSRADHSRGRNRQVKDLCGESARGLFITRRYRPTGRRGAAQQAGNGFRPQMPGLPKSLQVGERRGPEPACHGGDCRYIRRDGIRYLGLDGMAHIRVPTRFLPNGTPPIDKSPFNWGHSLMAFSCSASPYCRNPKRWRLLYHVPRGIHCVPGSDFHWLIFP